MKPPVVSSSYPRGNGVHDLPDQQTMNGPTHNNNNARNHPSRQPTQTNSNVITHMPLARPLSTPTTVPVQGQRAVSASVASLTSNGRSSSHPSMSTSSQHMQRRPLAAVSTKPGVSESPASPDVDPVSVYPRYPTSLPNPLRHRRSSSEEDDYTPKKKKPLSSATVIAAAVTFCLAVLIFIYIASRLFYAAPRSLTALTSSHTEKGGVSVSYTPLLPAVSVHNPLVSVPVSPPVIDLSIISNHFQNLQKRLPFHPAGAGHNTPSKPPNPADVPAEHPDYVPAPIVLEQAVPQKFQRADIQYVTNITPKHLRKVATPGSGDLTTVNTIDDELSEVDAAGNSINIGSSSDDSGDSLPGIKVIAGVKLSKAELAAAGAINDNREWSQEERNEMRSLFKQQSLNNNLRDHIIWRPPTHTLTISKEFPPPITTPEQYLFGDDVLFVMLTEKKNHGLVRKILSTWGQYVKHWQIYSDFYDSKLNTTVLKNPQPAYIPREYKYQSWRISVMLAHLAKHVELHYPFYMVIDQYSFPLLDQLKWRIDLWKNIWHQEWPNFIAGRPDKRTFKYSYWTEQQELASKLFVEPLQVVPTYAYGFDHSTLMQLSYYTPTEICPVLQEDNVALAALISCAGGVQQEYHFLPMTRYNHREKQLTATSFIKQWRILDVFYGERTAGMLEEAFSWYYGGVLVKTPDNKKRALIDSLPKAGPAPAIPPTPLAMNNEQLQAHLANVAKTTKIQDKVVKENPPAAQTTKATPAVPAVSVPATPAGPAANQPAAAAAPPADPPADPAGAAVPPADPPAASEPAQSNEDPVPSAAEEKRG